MVEPGSVGQEVFSPLPHVGASQPGGLCDQQWSSLFTRGFVAFEDTKCLLLVWPDPVGGDEDVYISVGLRGRCGLVLGPRGRSGWPPQEPGVLYLWPGASNQVRGACGIQKKNIR